MADAKPPAVPHVPLGTVEEVKEIWDRFRSGASVACPADGVAMALAVDAAVGVYRFVCTQCGLSSPWFESGPGGMHLRGYAQPHPRSGSPGD
jgi:hypothetical protein